MSYAPSAVLSPRLQTVRASMATQGLDALVVTSLAFANRTFGWMFRNPLVERTAQQFASGLRPGPNANERASRRATVVARATDGRGRSVESRLVTNEAYTFTAQSACAVMERIAEGCIEPGFQTPGKLLGADFVLQIDGEQSRAFVVNRRVLGHRDEIVIGIVSHRVSP